jgi:hypothetical protein
LLLPETIDETFLSLECGITKPEEAKQVVISSALAKSGQPEHPFQCSSEMDSKAMKHCFYQRYIADDYHGSISQGHFCIAARYHR